MLAGPLSTPSPSDNAEATDALLPDRLPMVRSLDPAAALAFRTPLMEHFLSADGKAAGVLTLLGMMFTVLARLVSAVNELLNAGGVRCYVVVGLIIVFAILGLGTVFQAFRTIAPRFPKAPPSLAFFGDIARLTREQYVNAIETMEPRAAVEQMLIYNHTTALICVEKSTQLSRTLRLFRFVSVVWLVLLIMLSYQVFH
jgi:hypothetical protein